jgi:hypothetical protein
VDLGPTEACFRPEQELARGDDLSAFSLFLARIFGLCHQFVLDLDFDYGLAAYACRQPDQIALRS